MSTPSVIDHSVKMLVRQSPEAICRLAGSAVGPEDVHFDDTVVNIPEFRADHLLILQRPDNPPRGGFYFEYQMEPRPEAIKGWFVKSAALNQQRTYPIVLLVVYLHKGQRKRFPSSYTIEVEGLKNTFRFPTVRLWEHVERIRKGDLQMLAPLLVLCEDAPTEQTLREERAIIANLQVDEERRRELYAVSIMVGRKFFAEDLLYDIFKEELPMIKELGFVEEWLREERQEGRQEGIDEGRKEGESIVARAMALLLLREKFGDLPEAVVGRIESESPAWCQEVAVKAMKAQSLQDVL